MLSEKYKKLFDSKTRRHETIPSVILLDTREFRDARGYFKNLIFHS